MERYMLAPSNQSLAALWRREPAGSRQSSPAFTFANLNSESSPSFFPSTRWFGLIQPLMKHISMPLTLVELLCNVSFWMAPVSQFLIFRKRGHLEGLPFCRDLVGEVLASAGGCKGTNESLLPAFQPFATSGMHLIPAVWLPRKADNRTSHGAALHKCPDWLPTGKVNLSSCTKQCQPSQLGGLSFESCFSLLCLSLSHRQKPLRFSPANAVSNSYWLMNACNLTWALALEKSTVWLPKIRVINPHGSSFMISPSICNARRTTATRSLGSWGRWKVGIPNFAVICCLQTVGKEWGGLNYVWFCTRREAKRSLRTCAKVTGQLVSTKIEERKKKHIKENATILGFEMNLRKTTSENDSPSSKTPKQVILSLVFTVRVEMQEGRRSSIEFRLKRDSNLDFQWRTPRWHSWKDNSASLRRFIWP